MRGLWFAAGLTTGVVLDRWPQTLEWLPLLALALIVVGGLVWQMRADRARRAARFGREHVPRHFNWTSPAYDTSGWPDTSSHHAEWPPPSDLDS